MKHQPEAAWEAIAQSQPYWGVLSGENFRGSPAPTALADFWASGEAHIAHVDQLLQTALGKSLAQIPSAVDFGCGVGRLLVPLAGYSAAVVGVDASPTMLAIAAQNLAKRQIGNVTLTEGVTALAPSSIRFAHSVLVFQHIPPSQGIATLRALLRSLDSEGFGFLHFLFQRRAGAIRKLAQRTRNYSPLVNRAIGTVGGRKLPYEMHEYPLHKVLEALDEAGFGRIVVYPRLRPNAIDVDVCFAR